MIPSPLPKAQLLGQLAEQITAEVKDPWLFPQRRAVAGFLGTAPIVIAGWRPSWSQFPDEGANRDFYDLLTEFGLENAHLTNVVKSRGKKDEPDPQDFNLHIEIFERELEILNAWHGVVAMGSAYDRIASFTLRHGAKPLFRLPQYASMNYGPAQIASFRKAIGDLATIASRRGWISAAGGSPI